MPLKPKKNLHTVLKVGIFIILFTILCYFRTNPIYYQTVAYTYDQGRDFLKVAEIIQTKRPTFIGPTTGIMGVFHGSWWYYILILPYLIFRGSPQGFYYGVLAIHLVALILFSIFLNKKLGYLPALLFILIVSVSPYFTKIFIFAGNNTLTPILILLFLFALFQFFREHKKQYLFLLGLSLGFVLETELSFGIYLIPSFFLVSLFFKPLRNAAKKIQLDILFFLGLIIPSIPRLLFEVKNHFLQTKALMQYVRHPTATNPQSLYGAFIDRIHFFQSYYFGIFYNYSNILALALLILSFISFVILWRKYRIHERHMLLFSLLLIFFIFLFSLSNRNNFFWENYLEGLQYIFLFVLVLAISVVQKNTKLVFVLYGFIALFFFLNFFQLKIMISDSKEPPSIGLRADDSTVKLLYKLNNGPFCTRIYTPPVFPHTYNYLFSYYSSKGYVKPSDGFINRSCWYIFDKETYQSRVEKWRKEQIPQTAILKKRIMMKNETSLELWEEQ